MGRKRDYSSEINDKKRRATPKLDRFPELVSSRWLLVRERLRNISQIHGLCRFIRRFDDADFDVEPLLIDRGMEFDYNEFRYDTFGVTYEIARYIPIGLTACMEGYFRQVYADLIDYGPPYRENAAKFKDIRFSIDTALSLEKNSVSLGDFIAHLLTTNNFADINENVSTLIGEDFIKRLKSARSHVVNRQDLFVTDEEELMSEIIQSVKYTFKLRHMFCHEADPMPVDLELEHMFRGHSGPIPEGSEGFAIGAQFRVSPRAVEEFLSISEFVISGLLAK